MAFATRSLVTAALVTALAGFSAPTVAAQDMETVKWYDLEVIIFRHADPRTDEKWPLDRGLPDIKDLQPLYPTSGSEDGVQTSAMDSDQAQRLVNAPEPYEPLPEDMLTMTNYRDALARSSRYEPILHFAWTQPSLEREQSPKLRITLPGALDEPVHEEGEDVRENTFGDEFAMSNSATAGSDIDTDSMNELAGSDEPDFARPLDGYMQLGVSRYLHVDMDLLYLPDDINPDVVDGELPFEDEFADEERQAKEDCRRSIMEALARGDITLEEADILMLEPEDQVFHGFRMNNVRRIRAGEVHYFDHPIYGVILKATPREIEVAQPEAN
ncbi:MAG: CsiV family protein [Gammaproteobacteria bacterium]|nr:CsiV family protein [Gammaproteobacteria bacterium]